MIKDNICLITGGAGFIGSHLSEALLAKRYQVYCLDNLITGSKKNLASLLKNRNFHFHQIDITKTVEEKQIFGSKKIDYVYHLASPASPPVYQKYSIETMLVNSFGTYQMLQLALKHKSKFLMASTSEIYGNPMEHPQKETYFGNVNPVGIRACYDEGKRFAEALTMEYVRKHKLNASIVRIFNTYGSKMNPSDGRVIINFITQALAGKFLTVYGDGQQTRSFCYISDMVDALIKTIESDKSLGMVFNLGFPREYTINNIARVIISLTKSSSKIKYYPGKEDDPVRRKPDISKAMRVIGWLPKVNLKQGLLQMIDYYKTL